MEVMVDLFGFWPWRSIFLDAPRDGANRGTRRASRVGRPLARNAFGLFPAFSAARGRVYDVATRARPRTMPRQPDAGMASSAPRCARNMHSSLPPSA
jgi:hypothetical protein